MRQITARLLVIIGLGLVTLGKKLDPKPATVAKLVVLPRRHYRNVNRQPSRGEVYRLGLSIVFNSLAWGLV